MAPARASSVSGMNRQLTVMLLASCVLGSEHRCTVLPSSQHCVYHNVCIGHFDGMGILWLPDDNSSEGTREARRAFGVTKTGDWTEDLFENRLDIPPFSKETLLGSQRSQAGMRLPLASRLHAAFLPSTNGTVEYPVGVSWVGRGLLLGNDPDRSDNPFHFAVHVLGGFAARLRQGLESRSGGEFDVVVDPSPRADELSPWQVGLVKTALLGQGAVRWVDAGALAELDAEVASMPGGPTMCFNELVAAGPTIQLVAGAWDSQKLRGLAASSFDLWDLYKGKTSGDISDAVTTRSNIGCSPRTVVITLVLRPSDKGRQVTNLIETVRAIESAAAEFLAAASGVAPGCVGARVEVVSWNKTSSFEEQVRQVASSDLLVAVHGASLVNSLWLPPGASVIEISPARFLHPMYARLSAVLGLFHFHVRASSENSSPQYDDLFEGWTAAACTSDKRCRTASKAANVEVPLDNLRAAVLDALDCSVPLAPKPLNSSVGLRFDNATKRYGLIFKAANGSEAPSTAGAAEAVLPPLTTPHVIHIGGHAGNGSTRFWVERHGWTATLVEPDPAVAAALSRSYGAMHNASKVVVATGTLDCTGAGATRPFRSGAKPLQAGDKHGGAGVGGPSLLDAKCLTAAELLTTLKPSGASKEGAAPLVLVVGAQVEDGDGVRLDGVDGGGVLAQVLLAEGLRPHLLVFHLGESNTAEKSSAEVVSLVQRVGYKCCLTNPESDSVVCARRQQLVGNGGGGGSDDQGAPHQALLRMFDAECWCSRGFNRPPFLACVNEGVDLPGCADDDDDDSAASSPADATRELGRVFSESAQQSWWAPGLPEANLRQVGSVAFSFQQQQEDGGGSFDGHISGYEHFNRARSISAVTVPFLITATTADADGPQRAHLTVTWHLRNYDLVTREVVSAAALAIVEDLELRGETALTTAKEEAAAQVSAALWKAVDGQCAFWGDVECDFPGAGTPRPVNGDRCCFAVAGDERGGGVFAWVPPLKGDNSQDHWTHVAEPEPSKGARERDGNQASEDQVDDPAVGSSSGGVGGACSHRGERGSCADVVSGGAWLWKTEGESACVKYDPREQERFRAALPALFPSVAATGRGVVDFGGSVGLYAAAFPPEAKRCVTVEPLVDPSCLFPGVTLDSRNYLAQEPPPPPPPPPRGKAEEEAEERREGEPTLHAGGYELVVSLETAEHVNPALHPRLVRWLASALAHSRTARLLFSAAMPSQHGDGHVGCKCPARWRREIEQWSAEAGTPLELDRSRTELARKAAGPYLNHILLVFRRVSNLPISTPTSSSLDTAATGAYTGAATVLRHVCVENGTLVLFGEAVPLVRDAVPWGSSDDLAVLKCRRGAFCVPRHLNVVRRPEGLAPVASRSTAVGSPPPPLAAWQPGLTLLVYDSPTLLNFGHAFSDFARELAAFLLLAQRERVTSSSSLKDDSAEGAAGGEPTTTEAFAGSGLQRRRRRRRVDRVVVPNRWPLPRCDPTSPSVVHRLLRPSGLDSEPLEGGEAAADSGPCEALAAWLHLALQAQNLSSTPAKQPLVVQQPSNSQAGVSGGACFEELLVLNDLDRDGSLLRESDEKEVLDLLAKAGHRAAGVEVQATPSGGQAPGAWPKRVLAYGRQDSPRRRLSNFQELASLLQRTEFGNPDCNPPPTFSSGEGGGGPTTLRLNVTLPLFSEMTLAEQARVWSESDVVVAPRGAHGANAVFMKPGALLVELMPPCRSEDWDVRAIASQRGVFVVQIRGQKPDGSACRPDSSRCRPGLENSSSASCLVDPADAEGNFALDAASLERVVALVGCGSLAHVPGGGGLVLEALSLAARVSLPQKPKREGDFLIKGKGVGTKTRVSAGGGGDRVVVTYKTKRTRITEATVLLPIRIYGK